MSQSDRHGETPIVQLAALQRRGFLRFAAVGAGTSVIGGGLLTACGGGSITDELGTKQALAVDPATCAVQTGVLQFVTTVVADTGTNAVYGSVTITSDGVSLFVKYDFLTPLDKDADLAVSVVLTPADVPQLGNSGLADPASFQFGGKKALVPISLVAPQGATTYTVTIALADVKLDSNGTKIQCGTTPTNLTIVAYANVISAGKGPHAYAGPVDANGNPTNIGQVAVNANGNGIVWQYFSYPLCCEQVPVTVCDTAFAKGTHVFTTDTKSNPDRLPSLELTKNRWGWAINLLATGTSTYDIYAGAGLNKTSKAAKVGTLTVVWDGSTVTVTYAITSGKLGAVHLYVGDDRPTTLAPGQYGNTAYLPDNATSYTFPALPVSNVTVGVDGKQAGIWLIAHAVVCH